MVCFQGMCVIQGSVIGMKNLQSGSGSDHGTVPDVIQEGARYTVM
jgi:hypothetical protein